jgi:hypothetical protein
MPVPVVSRPAPVSFKPPHRVPTPPGFHSPRCSRFGGTSSTAKGGRGMGYGLIGILLIILLVVAIVYFVRRA